MTRKNSPGSGNEPMARAFSTCPKRNRQGLCRRFTGKIPFYASRHVADMMGMPVVLSLSLSGNPHEYPGCAGRLNERAPVI